MNTYPPIHIQTHINAGNVAETLALMLGLVFLDADNLSVYPLSTLQVSVWMGLWDIQTAYMRMSNIINPTNPPHRFLPHFNRFCGSTW